MDRATEDVSKDTEIVLNVTEYFLSPQGEGARAGEISVFIRLQGCSAKHACFASGVACDTEFEGGHPFTLSQLLEKVRDIGGTCRWIIWTGGEPLDQLTPEIVQYFATNGFRQAIETSGVRPFPREFRLLFDWIVCSPKVAEHILTRHFGDSGINTDNEHHVHELRYVRHKGQPSVPQPSLRALTRYISPHSDGFTINRENVAHVINLCKANPEWRISIQQHKLFGVL